MQKWWNLFGLNPNFKEFLEKHPNKSIVGIAWALQWRFLLVVLAIEIIFVALAFIFGAVFKF